MHAPRNIRRQRTSTAACWAALLLLLLVAGAGCGECKLDEYTTTLKEDFDADEREEAAEKLGKLGDLDAVPALRAATRDPDDKVRDAA